MPLWAGLWDGATSTSSATSTVSPHTTSAPVTVKTVAPEEHHTRNSQTMLHSILEKYSISKIGQRELYQKEKFF